VSEDDDLLFADECAALVTRVTGRPCTVGAWKRAVSNKTKRNPAPDPEPDAAVPGRRGRLRPRWRAEKAVIWAMARPGSAGGIGAPELPGYWTAAQCAEAADISRAAWWSAVTYKTQRNPAPDPVSTSELPAENQRFRYWRPHEVQAWIPRRPGRGGRGQPSTDEVEAQLPPGRWTARMCAAEAGVHTDTWTGWMQDDSDAPRPVDRVGGNVIWLAKDVRAYLRRRQH
jgi:predicted DNA-binding transcriptional regulator AlpA